MSRSWSTDITNTFMAFRWVSWKFLWIWTSLKLRWTRVCTSQCKCTISVSGVAGLDFIICLWWHGLVFYWGSLFVSICNLVLVAFERFELELFHWCKSKLILTMSHFNNEFKAVTHMNKNLINLCFLPMLHVNKWIIKLFYFIYRFVCVCIPLRHNELTNKRIIICIVCMYFGSVAANWGTPIIGKCENHGNLRIAFWISKSEMCALSSASCNWNLLNCSDANPSNDGFISWNCLFEHIKSLKCYELTRRCSHLPLCAGFTFELWCERLVWTLGMCTDAETVTDFLNYLHSQDTFIFIISAGQVFYSQNQLICLHP